MFFFHAELYSEVRVTMNTASKSIRAVYGNLLMLVLQSPTIWNPAAGRSVQYLYFHIITLVLVQPEVIPTQVYKVVVNISMIFLLEREHCFSSAQQSFWEARATTDIASKRIQVTMIHSSLSRYNLYFHIVRSSRQRLYPSGYIYIYEYIFTSGESERNNVPVQYTDGAEDSLIPPRSDRFLVPRDPDGHI